MRPESAEFFALIEAAGWNQAEAARRLELNPGTISQYKGDVAPSTQTLKLLKMILANENPEVLSAGDTSLLHDRPAESDAALWRRRAKDAETKIAFLRDGLRHLLDKSGPHASNSSSEKGSVSKIGDIIVEELQARKRSGSPRSKEKP